MPKDEEAERLRKEKEAEEKKNEVTQKQLLTSRKLGKVWAFVNRTLLAGSGGPLRWRGWWGGWGFQDQEGGTRGSWDSQCGGGMENNNFLKCHQGQMFVQFNLSHCRLVLRPPQPRATLLTLNALILNELAMELHDCCVGGLVFHFDCERTNFLVNLNSEKNLLNCLWSTLENQILKLFRLCPKCTIFWKYYNSLVNSSTADLSHFNRPTWHGITSTQVEYSCWS